MLSDASIHCKLDAVGLMKGVAYPMLLGLKLVPAFLDSSTVLG